MFLEMMRTQLHNNLESRKGFIWDYTESYEKQYSVSHKNMNMKNGQPRTGETALGFSPTTKCSTGTTEIIANVANSDGLCRDTLVLCRLYVINS